MLLINCFCIINCVCYTLQQNTVKRTNCSYPSCGFGTHLEAVAVLEYRPRAFLQRNKSHIKVTLQFKQNDVIQCSQRGHERVHRPTQYIFLHYFIFSPDNTNLQSRNK